MNERVIKIEKIDPKDLFGPQNKNIKFIKLKFPELKIIARGDKIKAYGNKENLNDFEERINKIINYEAYSQTLINSNITDNFTL